MFLQDFALTPPGKCPESIEALARDTLALLRRRPEPDVAVTVLTEAGLLRLHEPIPLLRIGRSIEQEFEPHLEQTAQVGHEGCYHLWNKYTKQPVYTDIQPFLPQNLHAFSRGPGMELPASGMPLTQQH